MIRVFTYAVLVVVSSGAAFSQPAIPQTAFEMAHVRVSPHSDNPSLSVLRRGEVYELLEATMVDLIATAYGVKPDLVTGGPGWLEADRFDVIAKTPIDSTAEALRGGLQALLAERFGLVIYNDTKPMPAYILAAGKNLRVQQSDGSGNVGCEDQPSAHSATINGALECHGVTMAAFAETLQTNPIPPMTGYISGNAVVDRTGLNGTWNLNLKWTGRGALAKVGSEGITLFDALDKQLGLTLAFGKAPLPVLVVDRVNQRPTANLPGVTEKLPGLRLEFEIVDIQPSTQDKPTAPRFTPGGRMEVRGVTLIALIQHAWGLDTYDNELIAGGPKWLTTERFDIVAKATPPNGSSSALKDDDSLRSMLRNMLVDRFRLAVHTEGKQVTVYALVAEKSKLKLADASGRSKCSEEAAAITSQITLPQRKISCVNTTAAEFANRLHGLAPGYINRPVVDATGIGTAGDFSLVYSRPGVVNAGQEPASDPNGGVTLFEALEKQLGLKLEIQKHPMPVLVIDHVEQKPTDN